MKELSIEEKAKAYDEVRKKIAIRFGSNVADEIFYQFGMSEDEKIRKAISDILLIDNDEIRDILDANNVLMQDIDAWLEKQGEPKPTDKVEPKFKNGDVIRRKDGDGLEWTVEEVHKDGYYNIVNSDRDDFVYLDDNWELVEQKSAWSEEDEYYFGIIQYILNNECVGKADRENATTWFKFLKDRVQPQNSSVTDEELAQAKKEAYNEALDKIEYNSGEPTFDDGWSAAIWYLKKRNGKPQNRWKPSDEQLNNILDVLSFDNCTLKRRELLESLYNDLKKLKS